MRAAGAADESSWMARHEKPDTRVHDALKRIGPLPVLGGTVARIRTLATDPNGTTTDLVAVIESDEAFAANLLRYDGRTLGFHDLQHDYLLLHAPASAGLHAQLLDAYRCLLAKR